MRKLAAVLLACVAAIGAHDVAAAPDTSALIRPGVGIGKVRLGMTQAQVRRVLGRHTAVNVRERRFGLPYLELAFDYSAYTVGFFGAPGKLRVVSVATSLRRERTREGLGPGTSLRALRRALKGERCRLRRLETYDGQHTECTVVAPSGARTTFVAAPECSARWRVCGAPFVFEVVVSRSR